MTRRLVFVSFLLLLAAEILAVSDVLQTKIPTVDSQHLPSQEVQGDGLDYVTATTTATTATSSNTKRERRVDGSSSASSSSSSSILTPFSSSYPSQPEEDVRLRVTVRKDNLIRAPSCKHTFSQVEVLNLHNTEQVLIHSIHTAPEETILLTSPHPSSSPSSIFDGENEPAPPRSSTSSSRTSKQKTRWFQQPLYPLDWEEEHDKKLQEQERNRQNGGIGEVVVSSGRNRDEDVLEYTATHVDKMFRDKARKNTGHNDHDNLEEDEDSFVDELPKQIHMSRMSQSSLSLGPGQVAIIPVTFLPRFPRFQPGDRGRIHDGFYYNLDEAIIQTDGTIRHGSSDGPPTESPTLLSSWQEAELHDWFGSAVIATTVETLGSLNTTTTAPTTAPAMPPSTVTRTRSNRAFFYISSPSDDENDGVGRGTLAPVEEYQVSTILLVETNRGVVELPISATSIRQNEYGLPDRIEFDLQKGRQYKRRQQELKEQRKKQEAKSTASGGNRNDETLDTVGLERDNIPRSSWNGIWIIDSYENRRHQQHQSLGSFPSKKYDGTINDNPQGFSSSSSSSSSSWLNQDCFDLYMKNPEENWGPHKQSGTGNEKGENDIEIVEVLLSQPEYLSLHVIPQKCPRLPLMEQHERQVIRGWILPSMPATLSQQRDGTNDSGIPQSQSLFLPADGKPHYIVTVCTTEPGVVPHDEAVDLYLDEMSHWVDSGYHHHQRRKLKRRMQKHEQQRPKSKRSWVDTKDEENEEEDNDLTLGFLQIKTDTDTLFVGLERTANLYSPVSLTEDHEYESEGHASDYCVVETSTLPSTESFRTNRSEVADNTGESFLADPASPKKSLRRQSKLKAVPESIDFHLLSSSLDRPFARATLGIVNIGSLQKVHIMRASVAFQMQNSNLDRKLGLEVNILASAGGSESLSPIAFNTTVDNAFTLEVSVDWDKMTKYSNVRSIKFRGRIIIRGTAMEVGYDDWMTLVKSDPRIDSDLILEVPVSVHLVKGRLGWAVQDTTHPFPCFWNLEHLSSDLSIVDGMYFPFSSWYVDPELALTLEAANASTDETRKMDHYIRPFRIGGVDLKINEVFITDDKERRVGNESDSVCQRFHVSFRDGGDAGFFDNTDLIGLGLVRLTFKFPTSGFLGAEATSANISEVLPILCFLQLKTVPDTGVHLTPLLVYPGQLDVSANRFQSDYFSPVPGLVKYEDKNSSWHQASVGMDNVLVWWQSSKIGSILQSVLETTAGDNQQQHKGSGGLLQKYLYSLAPASLNPENSTMRPVLYSAGALAQNEIETLPLYITNHNPVPMLINIEVGEIEGMSISLAREKSTGKGDGMSIFDQLPRKPHWVMIGTKKISDPRITHGPYMAQPINGLRQFLLQDKLAAAFFNQFPYRDAVSSSELATSKMPLLIELYRVYAITNFHKNSIPRRLAAGKVSQCNHTIHPPVYGRFAKILPGKGLSGPVMISNDGKTQRRLSVCWDKVSNPKDKESATMVPPGGVARFEIRLRSPPSRFLEKDINEFLATGLVLSTNHGEVLPILISFEALQGKLEVSHVPDASEVKKPVPTDREGVIRVPMRLFTDPSPSKSVSIRIPRQTSRSFNDLKKSEIVPYNARRNSKNGIPLFMRSSFSRDVQLLNISSCNPWFEVILKEQQPSTPSHPFLGVNVGSVRSVVSCNATDQSSNASSFPSFFGCALSWLAKRAEIQPQGCGMLSGKETKKTSSEVTQPVERQDVERVVRSFRRAILVSEWTQRTFSRQPSYHKGAFANKVRLGSLATKSGLRSPDGIIAPIIIDAIADAWDAWRSISDFGLNVLSTSLRATIRYNSTSNDKSTRRLAARTGVENAHLISVALRNVTVESVLETPQLFDPNRARFSASPAFTADEDSAAIINFPPTLVARISSIRIPVKNPTSVPVRVRLAVAPPRNWTARADVKLEHTVDDAVRSRYLSDLGSPYVQTGEEPPATEQAETFHLNWWDGTGAFWLADYHGDLVRSLHNITIKAASGAHISLINPSLLAHSALLIGCGSRCGVRRDDVREKISTLHGDLRLTSPIGASAAAGITLQGRKRWTLAEANQIALTTQDDSAIEAGGNFLSGGEGPAPFAISFAALDEIIIPPFGEAELGPIFFRPPGRNKVLGCASLLGGKSPDICNSQEFESLVFLENSLTGLERLQLRGKALWEQAIFVEPIPSDGSDSFSDLEVRNGRPALVFSGTGESSKNGVRSVVKEVLVQNIGDVAISFSNIYLSSTARVHREDRHKSNLDPCRLGDFHLLECSGSIKTSMPLEVLPGKNASLHIEHIPRCIKREDYVVLNLEYDRKDLNFGEVAEGTFSSEEFTTAPLPRFPSANRRLNLARHWRNSLQWRKETLLVGYDMSEWDLSRCVAASVNIPSEATNKESILLNEHLLWNRTRSRRQLKQSRNSPGLPLIFLLLFSTLGVLSLLLSRKYVKRNLSSQIFQSLLNGTKTHGVQMSPSAGNNWSAAFRCLARSDPSSSDLQTLGREQIRHVVLARYRAMGTLPPQCFNNAGVFQRERGGAAGNVARATSNARDGIPSSNDRIRTLSDALFRTFKGQDDSRIGVLPCEIGWHIAAVRGIVTDKSLELSPVTLKTTELILRRNEHSISSGEDDESMGSSESEGESVTFHAAGDASDEEELVDEVQTESPRLQVTERESIPKDLDHNDPTTETPPSPISNEKRTGDETFKPTTHQTVPREETSTEQAAHPQTKQIIPPVKAGEKSELSPAHPEKPDNGRVDDVHHKAVSTLVEVTLAPKTETLTAMKKSTSDKREHERKGKKAATAKVKVATFPGEEESGLASESDKKAQRQNRVRRGKKHERQSTTDKAVNKPSPSAWINKVEAGSSDSPKTSTPRLRPPPGLPPPPGFGDSAAATPLSRYSHSPNGAGLHGEPAALSMPTSFRPQLEGTPISGSSYHVGSDILDSALSALSATQHFELARKSSPPLGPVGGGPQNTSDPLPTLEGLLDKDLPDLPPPLRQNSMTGFDVMDFLDGILNDGTASNDGGDGYDAWAQIASPAAPAPTVSDVFLSESTLMPLQSTPSTLMESSALIPNIPANPWASPLLGESYQQSSRAAAYGVALEDTGGDRSMSVLRQEDTLLTSSLPLLTPGTILGFPNDSSKDDDRDNRNKDDIDGSSFYANLLGE